MYHKFRGKKPNFLKFLFNFCSTIFVFFQIISNVSVICRSNKNQFKTIFAFIFISNFFFFIIDIANMKLIKIIKYKKVIKTYQSNVKTFNFLF